MYIYFKYKKMQLLFILEKNLTINKYNKKLIILYDINYYN